MCMHTQSSHNSNYILCDLIIDFSTDDVATTYIRASFADTIFDIQDEIYRLAVFESKVSLAHCFKADTFTLFLYN